MITISRHAQLGLKLAEVQTLLKSLSIEFANEHNQAPVKLAKKACNVVADLRSVLDEMHAEANPGRKHTPYY